MANEQRDYWFESLWSNLRRGDSPREALIGATIDTAAVFDLGPPRCEHGITDGEYCDACNKEMKRAQLDPANGNGEA